jgi:hypothetical protein
MASQTPKTPAKSDPREPKRGIKNPTIYAGTIVVLVIVVIAFVFLPMGGSGSAVISGNGRSLDFGSYSGKPIVYSQDSYMNQQVRELNDRFRQQGVTEDNYQLLAYQVYRGAFERTLLRMAAIDTVTRAGGAVTEDWLDAKVAESPAFQENGKFSAQKYHDATLAEKLSVRNQIRDDTLYQAYFADVTSVGPSSKELAFVKDMAKDSRTVEYMAYPLSGYPDSEVALWGKAHADLFRSLSLSSITVTSSEADAQKLYQNVKDKKATFEDAAKASSKDAYAQKGGAAGAKYFNELSAQLASKDDAEKLATLKTGDLSPVFKTAAGAWAFFKADAETAPADFSQPVQLAAVRDYMNRRERGTIEDWAIAKAKEIAAAGSGGFEAAAKKAGFPAKTVGPFPLNYGDVSVYLPTYGQSMPLFKTVAPSNNPDLSGASTSEKFLTAAFSLAPGAVSDPFILGDKALVLKVKEASASKDDETGMIDYLYPSFFGTKAQTEAHDLFMKSPLLKDNFSRVFFKYFQPAPAKKN